MAHALRPPYSRASDPTSFERLPGRRVTADPPPRAWQPSGASQAARNPRHERTNVNRGRAEGHGHWARPSRSSARSAATNDANARWWSPPSSASSTSASLPRNAASCPPPFPRRSTSALMLRSAASCSAAQPVGFAPPASSGRPGSSISGCLGNRGSELRRQRGRGDHPRSVPCRAMIVALAGAESGCPAPLRRSSGRRADRASTCAAHLCAAVVTWDPRQDPA